MDFLDAHLASTIFGDSKGEETRLPKFACGLVGCCEKKKKCCKKYKNGKRCKSCPKG